MRARHRDLARRREAWATSTALAPAPIPEVAAFAGAPGGQRSQHRMDNGSSVAVLHRRRRRRGGNVRCAAGVNVPASAEWRTGHARKIVLRTSGTQPVCRRISRTEAAAAGRRTPEHAEVAARRPPTCSLPLLGLDYVGHDFGPDSSSWRGGHGGCASIGRWTRFLHRARHAPRPRPLRRRPLGRSRRGADSRGGARRDGTLAAWISAMKTAVETALAPTDSAPRRRRGRHRPHLTIATRALVAKNPTAPAKPALDAVAGSAGRSACPERRRPGRQRSSADPIERAVALSHAAGRAATS